MMAYAPYFKRITAYRLDNIVTVKNGEVRDLIRISKEVVQDDLKFEKDPESMSPKELKKLIEQIQKKMKKAAADLDFETAAALRDQMIELKKLQNEE